MKKRVFGLLITLVLSLCMLASWFIVKKYYLNELVHSHIEESIGQQIENEFLFTFDHFSINWLFSKAHLNGINLHLLNQSDTVGYFKGDLQVDVKSWVNLFFSENKQIKNIVLKEARIYYSADYPLLIKDNKEKNNQILELNNISANGKLCLAKIHKEQSGQFTTTFKLTASLNNIRTDEFTVDKLVEQINHFQLSNSHYFLPDGFYEVNIEELAFTSFEYIAIRQIIINPIYTKKVFSQKKKIATDYISVSFDSIQLIASNKHINERIYIDQIHVFQPSIDVYKDQNYPRNQEYKAILVDLLEEIKMPLYVREIALSSMFIKYTELAEEADESGYLFFSEASAKISNITNVEDSLQISDKMLIEAEAKFYGVALLKTSMHYDLMSETGKFNIRGSLKPIKISQANAILSKLAPVKIISGNLDKLEFDFSGTRTHSTGTMWFEYSEFKVELMEAKYLNSNLTRKVLSGFGNMVLRNANPSNNGVFRVGDIKQERVTTKSMFNYWWISLQSGFLSTLGVNPEKQKINYKSGEDVIVIDAIGMGEK
jgi:hypothetical protein